VVLLMTWIYEICCLDRFRGKEIRTNFREDIQKVLRGGTHMQTRRQTIPTTFHLFKTMKVGNKREIRNTCSGGRVRYRNHSMKHKLTKNLVFSYNIDVYQLDN
jgi:hypothetical protein